MEEEEKKDKEDTTAEETKKEETKGEDLDFDYGDFWGTAKEETKKEPKEKPDEKVNENEKPQNVDKIVQETVQKQTEVSDYVAMHPELSQFREKIRQVASDPRMRNVRIESIVGAAIGYENAAKLGASIKQEKDSQANPGKPVGGTARETEIEGEEIKPYDELTPEEKAEFKRKYRIA